MAKLSNLDPEEGWPRTTDEERKRIAALKAKTFAAQIEKAAEAFRDLKRELVKAVPLLERFFRER